MLAKIENDAVTQFPYSLGMLRADNPQSSIPRDVTDDQLAEFDVMTVDIDNQPNIDADLQRLTQKEMPEKKGNKWVLGWDVVDLNEYEKKAKKKDKQKPQKRAGVEINGIVCSATRSDQDGLTAVAMGTLLARAASTTFPDTLFEFENGAELLITDANFDAYYAIWMPFRQSFYTGE